MERYRDRVFDQLQAIALTPGPALGFPKRFGGGGDVLDTICDLHALSTIVADRADEALGAPIALGEEERRQELCRADDSAGGTFDVNPRPG